MGDVDKRVHVYYSGRVQGVGFRFTAEAAARKHRVSGFACNLRDGRVEVVGEAPEGRLKDFLSGIKESLGRFIRDEQVSWEEPTGEFRGFGIHEES